MLVAALVGGVLGSVVFFFAYFLGIAMVGAGLGALIAHLAWSQMSAAEPPVLIVLLFAIVGTVAAMILQRYVIIVSTAFSGAWTIILGGLALVDRGAARAASDVWILYPFTPASGAQWVPIVWIAVGLVGTAVQLAVTGGKR